MAKAEQIEANLEAKIAKEEKTLKQRLEEMPKVKLRIPPDPANPNDVQVVGWNGIIYTIPRGKSFEVPEVIAQIWEESYEKTEAINLKIEQSMDKDIKVM